MSDKVGSVPLFCSVREGGMKIERGRKDGAYQMKNVNVEKLEELTDDLKRAFDLRREDFVTVTLNGMRRIVANLPVECDIVSSFKRLASWSNSQVDWDVKWQEADGFLRAIKSVKENEPGEEHEKHG